MGSKVSCPHCNMRLNIGMEMHGQSVQCPGCKNTFVSEGQAAPSPPPAQPEPPKFEGHQADSFPASSPTSYQAPYASQEVYPPTSEVSNAPQHAGFQPPQPRSGCNPIVWVLGCLGGGCLLIIILAVLVGMLLPAVQAVREEARKVAGDGQGENLLVERDQHTTRLTQQQRDGTPAPRAPGNLFDTVKYESDIGPLTAYVGKDPGDNKKHPAIIWLFGGFSNGIGEGAWVRQPPTNDQSASSYRESGMIMMYPSLRGGNDNPGHRECLWGEVNDVLAAADYLASLPYVDPDRIYLGGHSTGGTLALLCTAATDRFRATISLGPVDDVSGYGQEALPFNAFDHQELRFRNPIQWIASIKTKTFIIEGSSGNASSVRALQSKAKYNSKVDCLIVPGHDHFSVIHPVNKRMAEKLSSDTGPTCTITLDSTEFK